MTFKEAMQAMLAGQRVTYDLIAPESFLYLTDDGVWFASSLFSVGVPYNFTDAEYKSLTWKIWEAPREPRTFKIWHNSQANTWLSCGILTPKDMGLNGYELLTVKEVL
jgi:hypothetical protein